MRKKFKAPEMPKWFWLGVLDGCWCCKDKHACNHCKRVRKFRKDFFAKKYKGENK